MKVEIETTEASRKYATAHGVHYTEKKLLEALRLYKGVMAVYPNTQEAKYSRGQIKNIITNVVPEQELFDAQLVLTIARLDQEQLVGSETSTKR